MHFTHRHVSPKRFTALALAALLMAGCGDAGTEAISAGERRAAIMQLARQVQAHYLDASAGARIATVLRTQERAGAYDAVHDDRALAQRLSADLLQASHDRRLRVTRRSALPWRDHAGITSVSKIAADIGYIEIAAFIAPERAGARYAKAFGKLAGAKTIIVDLRQNAGGDADGLQLLTSYVVDRPIHYADLRQRDGTVAALWAYPQLAARPYLEQLTILIGPATCAEAENFAYAMQAWKRATVVGSRSAGVATSSRSEPLTAFLSAEIPDARVTLPLTGASWERGVIPDLVTRADALKEAKRAILTERLAHVTTPMGRRALLALLNEL